MLTPEQRKKLEEEQKAKMAQTKQTPISFDLPNLLAIPEALKNVSSSVIEGGKSLLRQAEASKTPVFNVVPLKEKMDAINQYETIDKELSSFQDKYQGFDPLEEGFDAFKSKFFPTVETPIEQPVEQKISTEVKTKVKEKAPVVSTAKPEISEPVVEEKQPDYYDLQASERDPNLAYQKALENAEQGSLLAGLLKASERVGRSIAGAGRLADATGNYEEVAQAFGANKRIMDEMAKRSEVDERLAQSDPNSNISKAAQEELKQLLQLEGKEIRDISNLSKLSAKDLAPQIALIKQRQQLAADKAKAEQDKLNRIEDLKYRYAALEAQKEMTREAAAARKEAAKLAKEQRKEDKEQERDIKTDEKVNEFITKRSDKLRQYREDLKKIEPNLRNIEQKLAEGVNSVEQINAIYDFIKRLDNTAVREGEIKLFGAGQSVFDEFEVLKSKLTANPKVISSAQFKKLFDRLKQAAAASRDFYRDELEKSRLEFENRAKRLIEKDPSYRERLDALDPEYFQQKRTVKIPSPATLELINKRSEEENKKRLEELRAKFRGTN